MLRTNMATKEDILGQFELFNIKPSEEVLAKCLQMCKKYNIDGEDMVDQWFAYTSSVLRGAAPTVEYLERMERKEFMKNKDQDMKKIISTQEQHPQSPASGPSNRSTVSPADAELSTPKGENVPVSRIKTPMQGKQLLDSIDSRNVSPVAPSGSFSKRTDSRSVRCSHGSTDANYKRTAAIDLEIKPFYDDGLKPSQKIMYEVLRKRIRCMDTMIEDLFSAIVQKHHLRLNDDNDEIIGENSLVYGRIVSDSDGKINSQSILLEQTQKFRGRTISLNLSKMSKYSLFSGQVVAVKGTYLRGHNLRDKIVADHIYADTNFSLLDDPPLTNETLQVVVACGPFTVQENLSFEPLNDLLLYVKEYRPHVLILTGPFYDRKQEGIYNGELKQSFDSFFFDMVDNIMSEIQDTHVIIVSSQREPHHFPVYPTPPYEVRQSYPNLTFMPDPCLVNINGLIIGATTADILFDIGSFELNMDKTNAGPPDRMGRLASHILKQQSFYPLDPPGKEMCIDFSLMERHGVMAVKPHVLILPSNLRHFIKEIDNCVVINPERLTKGNGGGTFARMEISPGSNPTVCGRTACEVLKI